MMICIVVKTNYSIPANIYMCVCVCVCCAIKKSVPRSVDPLGLLDEVIKILMGLVIVEFKHQGS
jgi:hypothetical protein